MDMWSLQAFAVIMDRGTQKKLNIQNLEGQIFVHKYSGIFVKFIADKMVPLLRTFGS